MIVEVTREDIDQCLHRRWTGPVELALKRIPGVDDVRIEMIRPVVDGEYVDADGYALVSLDVNEAECAHMGPNELSNNDDDEVCPDDPVRTIKRFLPKKVYDFQLAFNQGRDVELEPFSFEMVLSEKENSFWRWPEGDGE